MKNNIFLIVLTLFTFCLPLQKMAGQNLSVKTYSYGSFDIDGLVLDSVFNTVTGDGSTKTANWKMNNNKSALPLTVAGFGGVQLFVFEAIDDSISTAQADALIAYVKGGGILITSTEGTKITGNINLNKYIGEALLCNTATLTVSPGAEPGIDPASSYHPGNGALLLNSNGANSVYTTATYSKTTGVPPECAILRGESIVSKPCDATAVLDFIAPPYPGVSGGRNNCGVKGFAIISGEGAGPSVLYRSGTRLTRNYTQLVYDFLYNPTAMDKRRKWSDTTSNVNADCNVQSLSARVNDTATVCQNQSSPSILFTGMGGKLPYTFNYKINGGATYTVVSTAGSSTVSVSVPTGLTGVFDYSLISVTDFDLINSTNVSGLGRVTVEPSPTATISSSFTTCENVYKTILFTGTGTVSPYTFKYSMNGAIKNSSSIAGKDTVSVLVNTSAANTYTYTLQSVSGSDNNTCSQSQTGEAIATINPTIIGAIYGNATVCKNGTMPKIVFKGSGGTLPYTFSYTINGGLTNTITTDAISDSVSIDAPNAVGVYTYSLTNTQAANVNNCSQSQTAEITVNINPVVTGTLSGNTTICKNGTTPKIVFKGIGGTLPYTFNYTINGGLTNTVSTNSISDSVSVDAPNTVGVFTYSLTAIYDSGLTACTSASGSSVVTINPLPTASLAGDTIICQGGNATAIEFKGQNGFPPYIFTYKLNAVSQPNITTTATSSTLTLSTSTILPDFYKYKLIRVQDANTCSQMVNDSAIVNVMQAPKATIKGTVHRVCQKSASPELVFTGSSGQAPYVFYYQQCSLVNGAATNCKSFTVTSTGTNNTVTATAPTNSADTLVFIITGVTDAMGLTCGVGGSADTLIVDPLPYSKITALSDMCIGAPNQLITFTGYGVTAPVTFNYSISVSGGAYIAQTPITSIAPSLLTTILAPTSTLGTTTYYNGITSSNVCSNNQGSGSVSITVNPLPVGIITVSNTNPICETDSAQVTFTGSIGKPPYKFSYQENGGPTQYISTGVGQNSVNLKVIGKPGTYTYTLLFVKDSLNCGQVQSENAVITVDPLPMALSGDSVNICGVGSITVKGATSANGSINWTSNGQGTIFNPTSLTPTYSVSTFDAGKSVTLKITVKSNNACNPKTAIDNYTINVGSKLNATASVSSSSICENSNAQVQFTGSNGVAPYTFIYTINNSSPITVTTTNGNNFVKVNALTTPAGLYTYKIITIKDANCTDTLVIPISQTVLPLPTASIFGDTSLCVGALQPNILYTGKNGKAPYTFTYKINKNKWDSVLTTSASSITLSAATNKAGAFIYTLDKVSDANGCEQKQSGKATININDFPTASFTISSEESTTLGPEIEITDASFLTTSWLWNFGDGEISFLSTPKGHVYADTGTYKINLIASNDMCKDSTYKIVRINSPNSFYIPNSFTPNGDEINEVFMPKGDGILKFEMLIFDRWGKLAYTTNDINTGWNGKVNGSNIISQTDTYLYVINLKALNSKNDRTYRGIVNLIK
jgi:gliding motility-associated-like protein